MHPIAMVILLQVVFVMLCFIALRGSLLSLYRGLNFLQLGELKKYQSMDNVYRFMAGAYFGLGVICLWMAITMHEQGVLVYLMAFVVFAAAMGRVISISVNKTSESKFYRYLIAEVVLAVGISVLQYARTH
jgi:hypothetical protein